uniref:Mannan endo-1,6-alpha-mannosidase n=1 Tax=Fusarium oxysporum (strain Fo5176) TaxID=660025 RepID=A0A0D2XL04_FUSOF
MKKSSLMMITTTMVLVTAAQAINVMWDNDSDTPGNLPDPYSYYWWLTGDESYNEITTQAMLHQIGDDNDYMPDNQTMTEGNDDQGFWAMAAMSAAEHKYPDPPASQPQWIALVQAVFNEYVSRWDTKHCNGGLRWQIFTWNRGFDYKNSISNGCFFNIAARLARYTGNQTYADWAKKVWDWETETGLITKRYQVLDGVHFVGKCPSSTDSNQWSYNTGIYLYGAAVMYNITESHLWKTHVDGLLDDAKNKFVRNNVLYEQFCEASKQCDNDQQTFKGYLARWMAATLQVAPYTSDTISKILQASAEKAAASCIGSPDIGFAGVAGTACGFSWLSGTFDNLIGVGSQMNALQSIMYTLVKKASVPVTTKTGGSSKGNPSGGKTNTNVDITKPQYADITAKDKVGAGIITCLMLAGIIGGTTFAVI